MKMFKQYLPTYIMPKRELIFDSVRMWRIDFYILELQVAVEVEGWGHATKAQYVKDIYKYNEMGAQGWILLRVTGDMLRSDPQPFFAQLKRLIELRRRRLGK